MKKPLNVTYLDGLVFEKKFFVPNSNNDHEHCVICWDKFSMDCENLHEGYCSLDSMHWLCDECFKKYKTVYGWSLSVLSDDFPKL